MAVGNVASKAITSTNVLRNDFCVCLSCSYGMLFISDFLIYLLNERCIMRIIGVSVLAGQVILILVEY